MSWGKINGIQGIKEEIPEYLSFLKQNRFAVVHYRNRNK